MFADQTGIKLSGWGIGIDHIGPRDGRTGGDTEPNREPRAENREPRMDVLGDTRREPRT